MLKRNNYINYYNMKTQKKQPIKKAQLGAIVKGVKTLFGTGSKVAKAGNKIADNTKKIVKVTKKPTKTYGETGAYARAEDMNKSDFYRNRNNAGKTYSNSSSDNSKLAKAYVGAAAGLTAAVVANKNQENKAKAKTNPVKKTPIKKK